MSASLLSRLAVALLIAMGFVVPVEAVHRDEVVQGVAREVRAPERVIVVPSVRSSTGQMPRFSLGEEVVVERLFVKHRALLL